MDSEIHIWIFPKKRTLRVDIQIKSFYLSVHVVVELSSNIMRGNWGFRWWPKNALLWQITSNQNLVGMDQALDLIGIASHRLIYAVSLRVLLFIHFLFWKFGKRIIAQATRDILKKRP